MEINRTISYIAIVAVFISFGVIALSQTTSSTNSTPVVTGKVHLYGLISNLSTNGFTLNTGKDPNPKPVTVSISSNTTIITEGNLSSVSSLQNGMQSSVYGSWTDNTKTAVNAQNVIANLVFLSGFIGNIGSNGFSITQGAKTINVNVGSSVLFLINHQSASFSSLASGMSGSVYGSWTDTTRTAINAGSVVADNPSVSGRVTGTNGNQITVVNANDKKWLVNNLSNTYVIVNGIPSSFSDIVVGMYVFAKGLWSDGTESTLNAGVITGNRSGVSPPPGEFCHNFNRNLKVGDQNDDVADLQTALNNESFSVAVTGYFDEGTASAVTGFQEKYPDIILTPNNLKHGTGFVGPATRVELNKLYGCSKPNSNAG